MRARVAITFASLRTRNYRLFFTGQLISLIGNWMQVVAQDWLVLRYTHNSGMALGLVTALQFAPVLLLTLYAGKLADRYDKRLILVVSNAVWAGLGLAQGVLILNGAMTLGLIFVFAGAFGITKATETPVRQSFVSELVEPRLLPNALSLNGSAFNLARIAGPALAGVAIAVVGTGWVIFVNGISYLAPLAGLWLMRPDELLRPPRRTGPAPKIRAGIGYVRSRPDLLLPIVLILIVGMFGFNFQLTLPLMARAVFHTGAAQFGLLTTALAVGALGGALAGTQRRTRPGATLLLGSAAGFSGLETVVAFAPDFWSMAAALVPTGFFMLLFAQAANQRVQLGTEPALRGRVMALYVLVFLGTTPLGAPLIGWLAANFGPRSGLWFGGAMSLLATATAVAARARRQRRWVSPEAPRRTAVPGFEYGQGEPATGPGAPLRLHQSVAGGRASPGCGHLRA